MTALETDDTLKESDAGLLKKLLALGPLFALGIIKLVFFTSMYVTSMWLSPYNSIEGFLNHILYMMAIGLIMYNFLTSIGSGGGYVPRRWRPKSPENNKFLQFCKICEGFKAPRSHHCRKCGRCVMKMDHHCPWINNCVGHKNHKNFVYFLLFCITGSIHSVILLGMSLQKAYNVEWYETQEQIFYHNLVLQGKSYPPPGYESQIVSFTPRTACCVVFSIGLALGVIIALGILLYNQLQVIWWNETGIEKWINQKAEMRLESQNARWIYPYDLGWKQNLRMVFLESIGDGFEWPVRAECDQYTFTREQKLQKSEKQARQRPFAVIKAYSGRVFPIISYGCLTSIKAPINTDPRLKLEVGDRVFVTRWKKYWLYGELELSKSTWVKDPPKGWFPRDASVPCVGKQRKED